MSYTSQQFLLFDCSTLANFKNWAHAISLALSSSGWTQTADTGQVNWSTIASPPAAGSFVYEIWQPADALQTGQTAFYLKIQYGVSTLANGGPRVQAQLGTGTNGSGTLTGVTTTNQELGNPNETGTSPLVYDCFFSGDINRFGMMMWRSKADTTVPFFFGIERTKNTDGTDSSDGVCGIFGNGSSDSLTAPLQMIVFARSSTSPAAVSKQYMAIGSYQNATGNFFTKIPITPIFPIYGQVGNALTLVGLVHNQDIAEGCFFNTVLYGSTHTYICTQQIQVSRPDGSMAFCMRYD